MELSKKLENLNIDMQPKGWSLNTLGELCQIFGRIGFRGYTVRDIVKEGNGAIAISPSNIKNNKLDLSKCTYISWNKYEESPEIKLLDGDILLVKTGSTFGKTAIVKKLTEKATLNPQLVVLKNIKVNSDYLSYMMSFATVQKQISEFIVGGALPTLSQKLIEKFTLPVPQEKSEQNAIAEALSDADALIESLEKLIEKKRQIKQGAMQELLTGKKRLPGFSGEWKQKLLKTLLKFQVGFPFSSLFFNESSQGIRLVKNRDLKNDEQVFHYSGKYAEEFLVKNGDVLIGMDGDFVPCLWAKGTALLNQRVGRILPLQKLDLKFAFYFLIKPLKAIENATSATTVKHLSHSDIEGIIAPFPEIEEQIAIAQILSQMDNELALLEEKLSKARQIKQGMMQELLTGRVRLV